MLLGDYLTPARPLLARDFDGRRNATEEGDRMDPVLKLVGNTASALGLLVCLMAGLTRLLGSYHLLGFESGSWFMGGMALMIFGNTALLMRLTARL